MPIMGSFYAKKDELFNSADEGDRNDDRKPERPNERT
jgi:hypothetical protein